MKDTRCDFPKKNRALIGVHNAGQKNSRLICIYNTVRSEMRRVHLDDIPPSARVIVLNNLLFPAKNVKHVSHTQQTSVLFELHAFEITSISHCLINDIDLQ